MAGEIFLVVAGISAILFILLLYINLRKKNKYQVKVSFKSDRDKRGYVKPLIILISLIILLGIISTIGYYILNQSYSELIEQKNSLENLLINADNQLIEKNISLINFQTQLSNYQNIIADNNTKLQELKSGDEYHLHNPTFNEVMEFLENNGKTGIFKMITNAKNQGIRCAYVQIRLKEGMYELIGFNIIDHDMIYFEPETHYKVNPAIGTDYFHCVEGQPYSSYDEILIVDILFIW